MEADKPRHRSSAAHRQGRARAELLSTRLGMALKEARLLTATTQHEVAHRAGLSQARLSELERGDGSTASLETWSLLVAAAGEQIVAFLEHAPGADRPRDMEHLRRQNAVVNIARNGGWTALPSSRSIRRRSDRGLLMSLSSGGSRTKRLSSRSGTGSMMSAPASADSMRSRTPWLLVSPQALRTAGCGASEVCSSCAGRAAIGASSTSCAAFRGPLFAARFPGSSVGWLRAFGEPTHAMPAADGLLWTDRTGALAASRLVQRT
jgi:transcriptional regulator with XRE-family HTH domain